MYEHGSITKPWLSDRWDAFKHISDALVTSILQHVDPLLSGQKPQKGLDTKTRRPTERRSHLDFDVN